jgi:REP element-mobilizing transposase RayT
MDDPLAFFLTWTTYGSWLPGDERGWVDKPGQFRAPDPRQESAALVRMTDGELTLDPQQREVVEATIAEHCRIRGWQLHIAACRRQHVHVVLTAVDCGPDDVLDQLKAWCTRRLKELRRARLKPGVREKWWTQRGSRRRLYTEDSVAAAIRYVREGQDEPR